MIAGHTLQLLQSILLGEMQPHFNLTADLAAALSSVCKIQPRCQHPLPAMYVGLWCQSRFELQKSVADDIEYKEATSFERLTMAAFTSNSPGRKKIMKEAAVPPTMCKTAPRSDT